MRTPKKISIILLLVSAKFFALFGQASSPGNADLEKSLYENALLQAELLLTEHAPEDSLAYDLMADAQALATEADWRGGRNVLAVVFDLFEADANAATVEAAAFNPEISVEAIQKAPFSQYQSNFNSGRFQIESGIDYSLQEYESAFVETDSVLASELQNPYLGLTFYQPYAWGNERFTLNHRLRLDENYFNYSLFTVLENRGARYLRRFEADASYFNARNVAESDFLDSRIGFHYGNSGNFRNRWYLNLYGRYKWYANLDELTSNIATAGMTAYYEHAFNFYHSLNVSWSPGIYAETRENGYGYFINRLDGFYRLVRQQNQLLEIGMATTYQRYRQSIYREVDSDGNIGSDLATPYYTNTINRYLLLEPQIELQWAFGVPGIDIGIHGKKKIDGQADAINPNYTNLTLEGVPRIYIDELKSIGAGAFWEKQTHSVKNPDDRDWARQANYRAYGLTFKAEYINLNGMLLNLEYRVRWQRHPNATASWIDTYYSNRLIHSLSLFGWIPLTRHWQIQLFANYDKDEDQQIEFNDTRNTLLNFSFLYKF